MATAGALSGGGVALYGKRFSSLPTSLAGNRFHVATILSRPFDRVGQGFFYGRSLASAEVRSSTVMLGSRKLSIRNLFIRTESRAATQRISAEVSLRRRKAAIPIARVAPGFGRGRQARCRAGFISMSLRDLGNSAESMCRRLSSRSLFAAIWRSDSLYFSAGMWRKRYIKAMPPG